MKSPTASNVPLALLAWAVTALSAMALALLQTGASPLVSSALLENSQTRITAVVTPARSTPTPRLVMCVTIASCRAPSMLNERIAHAALQAKAQFVRVHKTIYPLSHSATAQTGCAVRAGPLTTRRCENIILTNNAHANAVQHDTFYQHRAFCCLI